MDRRTPEVTGMKENTQEFLGLKQKWNGPEVIRAELLSGSGGIAEYFMRLGYTQPALCCVVSGRKSPLQAPQSRPVSLGFNSCAARIL